MTEFDRREPRSAPLDVLRGGEEPSGGRFESLFARASGGPPIAGDLAGGETVEGFHYDRPAQRRELGETSAAFDRYVLGRGSAVRFARAGDFRVTSYAGVRAPLRLHRVHETRIRDATESERALFDELLGDRQRRWRVHSLIDATWDSGHELWLVGGAVRDILREKSAERVKDLDCTGTMPAGAFSELAAPIAQDADFGLVCTDNPVVRVRDLEGKIVLEYKPLVFLHDRIAHPVSDDDLEVDAWHRDLTINAMAYDPVNALVLDPTGNGESDLDSLVLRPGRAVAGPLPALRMFLRLSKFVLRYRDDDANVAPGVEWVGSAERRIRDDLASIRTQKALKDILRAFYGDETDPDDDPGLARLQEAAAVAESRLCTELARLIAVAYG